MSAASKKVIKGIVIALAVLISVPIALVLGYLISLSIMFSPEYTYRVLSYAPSSIIDYKQVFPSQSIANEPPAFNFKIAQQPVKIGPVTYTYDGKTTTIDDFEKFLGQTKTTALIIVKDDVLLYEKYLSGYTRDSINRSFSAAKSFTSTLVGLAVHDGYIRSIEEPIITYLPELKGRGLDKMTISDLMLMNSAMPYNTNDSPLLSPFYDECVLYYLPDMRTHLLSLRAGPDPIGAYFLYHNAYPLLEGMILERAIHKTPSAYLEEKIWKPLGMEYSASWSLYSEGNLEQMGGGINARSIDFAKFARLFLNDGNWNGKQILPAGWVKEATSPDPTDTRPFKTCPQWKDAGGYYKYHWWGMRNQDGTYDYAAFGAYGQIIYISPGQSALFIRNGFTDGFNGDANTWGMIARSIIQSLK